MAGGLVVTYLVEIVEQRVVQTADGESGMPTYPLLRHFSAIARAEEAGRAEIEKLRRIGRSAFYRISDLKGRPVGPSGVVVH